MSLEKYTAAFQRLRVDRSHGAPAPHKPILLLAVIDLVEQGVFSDGKVYLLPELVMAFEDHWNLRVKTDHQPKFELPFFHLRSEPFWKLVALEGMEIHLTKSHSIRSRQALHEALDYAALAPELFVLLTQSESRRVLRKTLMDTYGLQEPHAIGSTTEKGVVADSGAVAPPRKTIVQKVSRDASFATQILRIYNHTCAMTGLRVTAMANLSMVDACHIIPHSNTQDDRLTNGIALSPTLHRAFDRGLVSIDDDYRILIQESFREALTAHHTLRPLAGQRIYLPQKASNHPSKDALAYHRRVHGFED